jgi:hypothetical protein
MKPEFLVLGMILLGALYFFWTQKLRTDITALLVMLLLAVPWPHGKTVTGPGSSPRKRRLLVLAASLLSW